MTTRGSYAFEVDDTGRVLDNDTNLAKLRCLFRDSVIIANDWGPGDPGDFDNGSWHILCHLAGGSGVLAVGGGRAWCGITHVLENDTYLASLVYREGGAPRTVALASAEGAALLASAEHLGFVEGASLGHISFRGANDPSNAFNNWPRQMFDKGVMSQDDGGVVWEHWSTTRDIRPSSTIGTSVLRAWLSLVSALGGRFVAAVARGRREHSHPTQLAALVRAGLLTREEATWETTPVAIPETVQALLYEARPADSLAAAEKLPYPAGHQTYFMYERRIDRWSTAALVRSDLGGNP